ncbi:hypothetical protein V6N11_040257 [Hibiscus sabdariffa]|uniref:Uncharacterized protein n=1 Tax=Hibiscus sabdariffa TaxID=183260 RepID=A0ABR2RHA5_9ROSI
MTVSSKVMNQPQRYTPHTVQEDPSFIHQLFLQWFSITGELLPQEHQEYETTILVEDEKEPLKPGKDESGILIPKAKGRPHKGSFIAHMYNITLFQVS